MFVNYSHRIELKWTVEPLTLVAMRGFDISNMTKYDKKVQLLKVSIIDTLNVLYINSQNKFNEFIGCWKNTTKLERRGLSAPFTQTAISGDNILFNLKGNTEKAQIILDSLFVKMIKSYDIVEDQKSFRLVRTQPQRIGHNRSNRQPYPNVQMYRFSD